MRPQQPSFRNPPNVYYSTTAAPPHYGNIHNNFDGGDKFRSINFYDEIIDSGEDSNYNDYGKEVESDHAGPSGPAGPVRPGPSYESFRIPPPKLRQGQHHVNAYVDYGEEEDANPQEYNPHQEEFKQLHNEFFKGMQHQDKGGGAGGGYEGRYRSPHHYGGQQQLHHSQEEDEDDGLAPVSEYQEVFKPARHPSPPPPPPPRYHGEEEEGRGAPPQYDYQDEGEGDAMGHRDEQGHPAYPEEQEYQTEEEDDGVGVGQGPREEEEEEEEDGGRHHQYQQHHNHHPREEEDEEERDIEPPLYEDEEEEGGYHHHPRYRYGLIRHLN